jgi:uncharacterized protein (DUF1778 family)
MAVEQTPEMTQMNFRLPREVKHYIERAAIVSGMTVTDFAISSLLERAQEVLDRQEQRNLSDRDRAIFLALLTEEAEPNEALKQAVERYRQLHADE